jgi:ATP-dependent DNA ligase
MELEGLVSERTDSRCRGGRSADWIKMKNQKHPAMNRVKDSFS